MNKMNIKIVASILLVGVLSGCTSKSENVKYDNENKVTETKVDNKAKITGMIKEIDECLALLSS